MTSLRILRWSEPKNKAAPSAVALEAAACCPRGASCCARSLCRAPTDDIASAGVMMLGSVIESSLSCLRPYQQTTQSAQLAGFEELAASATACAGNQAGNEKLAKSGIKIGLSGLHRAPLHCQTCVERLEFVDQQQHHRPGKLLLQLRVGQTAQRLERGYVLFD